MDKATKFKRLNKALKSLGAPVAYHHFDEAVEAPFIVYYSPNVVNTLADNSIYHQLDSYEIELYTDYKDIELEQKMHDLLTEMEIIYYKYETYIKDEKLYMQTYQITV